MVFEQWNAVMEQLAARYQKQYYTPERIPQENPLEFLVVRQDVEQFFGTKVLNIFICGKNYGWVFEDGEFVENWPPEGYLEAVDKHIATYKQYALYYTFVWVDFTWVYELMDANPESRIEEMMEAVDQHMKDLCEFLADYGFVYMGRIEEAVEGSYFEELINNFLATRTD